MANGFDASSILSSYMEGANFVTRGMERAEEARRKAELEDAQGIAGESLGVVAPKYDANGNVIIRSAAEIAQSPEFKSLANRSGLQPVLMQGIQDPRVKAVRYVGAVKGSSDSSFIPVLQHLDEDGKVISEGPLTQDRSSSGNAPIGEMTVNDVFNHAASAVYAKSPELGVKMFEKAKQNALGALQEQFRTAPEAQRGDIAKVAQSNGYNLTDLVAHSGAQERKADLERGGWWVTDPITRKQWFEADPSVRTLGDKAHQAGTDRTLKDAEQKADQDLAIDQKQFGARQIMRTQDQIRQGEVSNELANRFQGDVNDRTASATTSQRQTSQTLTLADNQAIEKSVTDLDSKDPAVVAQAQQGLLKYFKSPEDARNYVRGSQAETKLGDLRSAVLSGTPDDAYRNVAKELPYANKDTQLRVFTELAPLANDPDPKVRENAQAGLRAAANAMKGPQQGKAADPGEFNASMASSYMKSLGYKSDTPEFQSTQAGATEAFNRLRKALPNEITKGSQAETYATIASVKAHDLAQQGMPNAEKPMFIHSELEDLGYPVQRMGTTKDFVKEIYNPLGDALTKAGIPEANDPTTRRIGTELVVGLKSNGVSTGIAVNEVVKLFKDPPRTYLNKLEASGGDLRSLASGLAKEIKERPSALGQALDKTGRAIDAASME